MAKPSKYFKWTNKKLDVARAIAEGIDSQRDIAKSFGMDGATISVWKQSPEFMEKVDEFTLAHERATKAGLLREAYKGLGLKEKHIEEDKSTHLDYVKYVSKIQGHEVDRVEMEHSGGVAINLVMKDCSKKEEED